MTWERQRAYDLDAGREEGIEIGAQQKAVEDAENMIKKITQLMISAKLQEFL